MVIPFTGCREIEGFGPTLMEVVQWELSRQVRYLGVILNWKLKGDLSLRDSYTEVSSP